jgi:hypothetical protein
MRTQTQTESVIYLLQGEIRKQLEAYCFKFVGDQPGLETISVIRQAVAEATEESFLIDFIEEDWGDILDGDSIDLQVVRGIAGGIAEHYFCECDLQDDLEDTLCIS